jgi:hypothetical protein
VLVTRRKTIVERYMSWFSNKEVNVREVMSKMSSSSLSFVGEGKVEPYALSPVSNRPLSRIRSM